MQATDVFVQEFLLQNMLGEDELEHELPVRVQGTVWDDDEYIDGVLFVTSQHIGFTVSKDRHYINFKNLIRDVIIDIEENSVGLRLVANTASVYQLENDVLFYVQAHQFEELADIIWTCRLERYVFPLGGSVASIVTAIRMTEFGKLDGALKKLDTARQLDPLCGLLPLLTTRTVAAKGLLDQAAVLAATECAWSLYWFPLVVLYEYAWYEWHAGAARVLPSLTEFVDDPDSKLQLLLTKALLAKSDGQISEFLKFICEAFLWQYEDDETVYELWMPFVSKLLEYASASHIEIIRPVVEFVLKRVEKALRELPKLTVTEEWTAFKRYLETAVGLADYDLSELVSVMVGHQDLAGNSALEYELYQENFLALSQVQYQTRQADVPPDVNLETLLVAPSLKDAWRLGSGSEELVSALFKLFGQYRRGDFNHGLLEAYALKMEQRDSVRQLEYWQAPDSTMLVCLMMAERTIRSGEPQRALQALHAWKKRNVDKMGAPGAPFVRYADHILQAYEAWALSSPTEIRLALCQIPKNRPYLWIHEMFGQVADDLESQRGIPSDATDAIRYIEQIHRSLKRLSNHSALPDDVKNEIQKSEQLIEDGLQGIVQIDAPVGKEKFTTNDKAVLRIAIAGQTGAGKSTLMNRVFNTNLFFATQGEATGVPTEFRHGPYFRVEVWHRDGHLIDSLDGQGQLVMDGQDYLVGEDIVDYVRRYTYVEEAASDEVARVCIYVPLPGFPRNLVLIDTPGFNADSKREAIAREMLRSCHVCMFVLDAGSALTKDEVHIFEWLREEAAKALLVLNKMDTIVPSEEDIELGIESEDTVDELIAHLNNELVRRFPNEKVPLYPVSAMRVEQVADNARVYSENAQSLFREVLDEAVANQVDLMVDVTAKHTIALSDKIIRLLEVQLQVLETEIEQMRRAIPEAYTKFEQVIPDRLEESLHENRGSYMERMEAVFGEVYDGVIEALGTWLGQVNSVAALKSGAEQRTTAVLKTAIQRIEQERKKEHARIVRAVSDDVLALVDELYTSLPFTTKFKPQGITSEISGLSTGFRSDLHLALETIQYDQNGSNSSAFLGGAIGALVLGPLGALIGGIIGKLLGGKSLDTIKQEVGQTLDDSIAQVFDNLGSICEADLSDDQSESFFMKLAAILNDHLSEHQRKIDAEIRGNERAAESQWTSMIHIKQITMDGKEYIGDLRRWRQSRRSGAQVGL